MLKNRYRFSLQWQADTPQEKAVGEFLKGLGHRKSKYIIGAVWECMNGLPEDRQIIPAKTDPDISGMLDALDMF